MTIGSRMSRESVLLVWIRLQSVRAIASTGPSTWTGTIFAASLPRIFWTQIDNSMPEARCQLSSPRISDRVEGSGRSCGLVAGVPIAFPSSFHLEDSDALTSLLSSVQPPDTSLIIEHTVKRAEDSKTQGREGIRDETAENKTGDEHAHRRKYLVLHTPEIVQKLYSSSTKNAYQGSETIVPHDERAKKAQGEIIHGIPDRTINVLLSNLVTAKGNNITVWTDVFGDSHGTDSELGVIQIPVISKDGAKTTI
ncbi:hypothetical protein B0H14DRAFT_2577434 [Mycena olivaceomarginata]|nr:hypothetical protein B0H14DRAFT_2577434 [Mycena olivaceomarginata]